MISLIAKSACEGLLPLSYGSATLTEAFSEAITSVMPLKGQDKAVSAALKDAVGAELPGPGRTTGNAGARVVWSGTGQAMVLGPRVTIAGAAVTDQSDGWACMALEGEDARAVLARLVPLDLRVGVFKSGHAARTLLGHMSCVLMRTGKDRYGLMVFRSMAKTAVHELEIAMKSVAAQR